MSNTINGFGHYSADVTELTGNDSFFNALLTGDVVTGVEPHVLSGFNGWPATISVLILLAFLAGVILTGLGRTKKLGTAVLAGSGAALLLFALSALATKQGVASWKTFLKVIFPLMSEEDTDGMSFDEALAEATDEDIEELKSALSTQLTPELNGGVFLCLIFALALLAFAVVSFLRTPGAIIPQEWKNSTSANAARSFNTLKTRVATAAENTSFGQGAGAEPTSHYRGDSAGPAKPADPQ